MRDIIANSPPVAVAGMGFFGYPIADWVQVAALLWIVVQVGIKGYDRYRGKD